MLLYISFYILSYRSIYLYTSTYFMPVFSGGGGAGRDRLWQRERFSGKGPVHKPSPAGGRCLPAALDVACLVCVCLTHVSVARFCIFHVGVQVEIAAVKGALQWVLYTNQILLTDVFRYGNVYVQTATTAGMVHVAPFFFFSCAQPGQQAVSWYCTMPKRVARRCLPPPSLDSATGVEQLACCLCLLSTVLLYFFGPWGGGVMRLPCGGMDAHSLGKLLPKSQRSYT